MKKYETPYTDEEVSLAKWPHDIILFNLIANHILFFIGILALSSEPLPILIVPLISLCIKFLLFSRGRKILASDANDYVKIHWEIAMQRKTRFIQAIMIVTTLGALGAAGYYYFGWMKELTLALIVGLCIVPLVVYTLILVFLESDAHNKANKGLCPKVKFGEKNNEETPTE